MPKPNTRFLRHIIKDTDTHNKNLLAKEAAESKARLEDLEHAEEVKRLKTNPNTRDIRRRQMGDIHAILGGKKHRRREEEDTSSCKSDDKRRESRGDDGRRSSRKDKDLFNDRDSRKHNGRLADDDEEHKIRGHAGRSSRRRRDGSPDSRDDSRRSRHGRRRRDGSRSPVRRRRSRSPNESKRRGRHRHRSPIREAPSPPPRKDAEDSDPLDDMIGPMPAPKPRGRGAVAGSSGIDRRFSDTYDPKWDVQMDDDGGDNWDDAVEAFRDRQKLRQHQEQRMRGAGFDDSDIQKIQGSGDKSEEEVRWSKAGEKLEWDKDKVLGHDGI